MLAVAGSAKATEPDIPCPAPRQRIPFSGTARGEGHADLPQVLHQLLLQGRRTVVAGHCLAAGPTVEAVDFPRYRYSTPSSDDAVLGEDDGDLL